MSTTTNYHNLSIDYQLHDYQIQAILGEGHFGITYLAFSSKLHQPVVLKEYFPKQLAIRQDEQTVHPQSESEQELFQFGLEQFIQEGQALAQLQHPNIVQILEVFSLHNTAYWVMRYEQGQNLAEALEQGDTATQAEITEILPPLLSALTVLHEAGCLHQDIKPKHICFRDEDHSPVLLEFGAARYALATRKKSKLSIMVTPGYAPFEQYQNEENQGAWTDIYALGAVLYHAISGNRPLEATTRVKAKLKNETEPLPPAIQIGDKQYSESLLQGIDWALAILDKDRPQTVKEWEELIFPQLLEPNNKLSEQNDNLPEQDDKLPKQDDKLPEQDDKLPEQEDKLPIVFPVVQPEEKLPSAYPKTYFFKFRAFCRHYLTQLFGSILPEQSQTSLRLKPNWFPAAKRIVAIVSVIVIIATGIGFSYIFSMESYLKQLEQQQANLEQEHLMQSARKHELAELERKQAKEYLLALVRKPPYPASLIEQTIPLPSQEILLLQGHQSGICVEGCIAFSPDGRLLASGSWDHTIKLWNLNTGKVRQTLEGHKDSVLSIAFSPNGLLLASGSADSTIKLWEVSTGKILQDLTAGDNWVGTLAFNPNGQILAAEGSHNSINLWELSTGKILNTLRGHNNIINAITFIPDGSLLASGSADHTIKLWEAKTGTLQQTLSGHKKDVLSIAFSPDGFSLASGDAASTIKIWSVFTGRAERTWKGHKNWVLSVAFRPDGQILASGSHDHTIKFWDISQGKLLGILQGHKNDVNTITFSPDGRIFASGSRDKTIKLWQ